MILADKIFSKEILDAICQTDIGIKQEELCDKPVCHLTKEERELIAPQAPGTDLSNVVKLKASNTITIYFFFDDSDDISVIWVSKKQK